MPSTASPLAAPRRRELTRLYKESPPAAGVYALRNLDDGRLWLGASLNAAGALNRLRFELDRGAHRNRVLQQDWARLGAARFSFEVIDTVKPKDDPAFDLKAELTQLLQLWRTELAPALATGYGVQEFRA